MLKHIRQLYRVTFFVPAYTPLGENVNSSMFLFVKDRMQEMMKGNDVIAINRTEFEEAINDNEELADAYLQVFNASASFYKCKFEYEATISEFFIMYDKRIVLVYFAKRE